MMYGYRRVVWAGTLVMVCAAAMLLPPSVARATQGVLLDDAFTQSTTPATNYGTAYSLGIQGGAVAQKSYLKFDVSTVPTGTAGSNVDKAVLKIFFNKVTTGGSISIGQVTVGAWAESTLTASTPAVLTCSPLGSVAVPVSAVNEYVTYDVTGTVMGWVDTPASNLGFCIVPVGTFSG